MTAETSRSDRLQAKVTELSALVEQVAEANAHAADLMIQLEITRGELQTKNEELTEQVQALERAEAATEAQRRFLATVSHELRTPMNCVLGMYSLMLDTELTLEQRSIMATAHTSAQTLLAVIDDLLDLSKIQADALELERIPFDAVAVIEEVADVCAHRAMDHGVEVVIDIDPDLPRAVLGDPTRLRQILLNLVGNAVKFTTAGHVAVRARPESQDMLRIEVEDTGIGIDPDLVPHLFEPFAQADGSTTRRFGGTGLGLTICRELVRLYGGSLDVVSEPGVGSTFSATLRLPPADAEPRPPLGRSFLFISPHEPLRSAAERGAPRWGATMVSVASFEDALTRPRSFDVLLLDEALCGRGHDFEALRATPGLASAQVLVLAEYGSACAKRPEGSRVLNKPLKWSALQAALVEPSPPSAPRAQPLRVEGRAPRVLVAEDHPVNQRVIQHMLEKMGCEVTLARDGVEALQSLDDASVDLVLMDCHMPNMDGYEATRRLREGPRARERLPVIAVTASAMAAEVSDCLVAGMNDHLSKPVDAKKLRAKLTRWLATTVAEVQ